MLGFTFGERRKYHYVLNIKLIFLPKFIISIIDVTINKVLTMYHL
jgi:hypothetical protein